jgi:hypothetical protein
MTALDRDTQFDDEHFEDLDASLASTLVHSQDDITHGLRPGRLRFLR